MNLDLKEITFVIVSYKSKKVIFNCINSLPKFSKIIVIENSFDEELKRELEAKYDNIEVMLNENLGMGHQIILDWENLLKFAFILTQMLFLKIIHFPIYWKHKRYWWFFNFISINENDLLPNFEIKGNYLNINKNILEVDVIDGFQC